MARFPRPWYRKTRGLWYVTLSGKQHNLGPDRDAAFARYHELMRQPARTQVATDSVAVHIDLFLDWTLKHRAKRTYEFYLERLQSFVRAIPADQPVVGLKPFHVQWWIDAMDCSNGHKRGCITSVKRAMNWAMKMGYIERNPVASLEKPEAGRRETVISESLYMQILRRAHDQCFIDLLTVAWQTGARPQELLAVEARHVDVENARWVFPRSESKGRKRQRIVYLPDESIAVCQRLMVRHPHGKLFRNAKDEPWHRNNVNCRFVRMKKHIGVKLCLYNFRHSFATRLLESGVDSMIVATLLGHADLSMLGRTYAHLTHNTDLLRNSLKRAG